MDGVVVPIPTFVPLSKIKELPNVVAPVNLDKKFVVPAIAVVNEEVEAKDDEVANEAVPNKEPVIPFVTSREFNAASDPLMITFFQLGNDCLLS